MLKVAQGKVIDIEYTLTLEDGEVADATEGEPVVYLHGSGEILPGLEQALEGHDVGDKVTITLAPPDAYGEYDAELTADVPRSAFPEDAEIEEGDEVDLVSDDGEELTGWIESFDDENVHVDLDHPLAGETLTIAAEVMAIRDATPEEVAHGHAHNPFEEDEEGGEDDEKNGVIH